MDIYLYKVFLISFHIFICRIARCFTYRLIHFQITRYLTNLPGEIDPSRKMHLLTLHNEDSRPDIALLYDYRASRKRDGVHTIDDLPDLRAFQIFHKVVVQYGSLDQLAGP